MRAYSEIASDPDHPAAIEKFIHCTDGHNLPPRPGLGYMLFAVAEAFFYAYLTRRTLIVDWRDTEYLRDGDINLFTHLFECDSFLGVPILTDRIDEATRGKSHFVVDKRFYETFIARWEGRKQRDWALFWNDLARLRSGTATIPQEGGEDLSDFLHFPLRFIEDEVIATPFVGAVLAYTSKQDSVPHRFLRQLKLRGEHREVVDAFRNTHFLGKQVVGIHIRHGNGERGDFSDKRRQIADLGRLLDNIERAIARAMRMPLAELAVFLCTDSETVVAEAARRFPNLITRPQWRPRANAGCSLHLGHLCPGGAMENAANAAIDMFLLGACDYLAQVGQGSWFAKVAARLIGRDRVILVDPDAPNIDDHVFACGEMPSAVRSRAIGRASVGKAGHLVYGPYVRIEKEDRYCAELHYLTVNCPRPCAGMFEVVVSRQDGNGAQTDFATLARIALPPTNNRMQVARVEFDTVGVGGMLLELRVYVEADVVMYAFHIRTLRHSHRQAVHSWIGSAVRRATSQARSAPAPSVGN